MANLDKVTQVIDVIRASMTPNEADKGLAWIQNFQKRQSAWEVRDGFGVVDQFDTKLSAGKYQKETPGFVDSLGLEKHLGSYFIKRTSFGHKQVVSVWRARCVTSNMASGSQFDELLVQRRKVYVVRIYDITTDEHWEEILHYHTSQEEGLLFRRHGNYETSTNETGVYDRSNWVDAGVNEGEFSNQFNSDKDEYFYFTETQSADTSVRLIFGNSRAGAWVYSPCDFKASEYRFRESWNQTQADASCDWRDPYSESAIIQPIRVKPGDFYDDGQGLTYVDQATFGKPQAACTLGNRVVYATGNMLYFSDPEVPNSIAALNIQAFPSKVVAIAPTLGNLLVWTENATYYYNPAEATEGGLISGGTVTEISVNVGCLGPNCWTSVNSAIYWIDKTGIWKNYGNVTAQKISDNLDVFFVNNGLSNPMTSFYTQNGGVLPSSNDMPRSFYDWSQQAWSGINVCYNPSQKRIFFNIPVLNIAFVLEDGGFHVWNFESLVSTQYDEISEEWSPVVKAQNNIPFSWLLCDNNRDIFMVSGIVEQNWSDTTFVGGTVSNDNEQTLRSGLLLQFGRGGGLDRTCEKLKEDRRRAVGEYQVDDGDVGFRLPTNSRDKGYFYIDKVRVPPRGKTFYWTSSHAGTVSIGANDVAVQVPFNLVPSSDLISQGENVTDIQVKLKFDNIHWQPYFNTANPVNANEVVYNLPPERFGSSAAYYIGAADTATQKGIYVTNGAGAADPNGNVLWINIRGSDFPGSWPDAPNLNFAYRFKNLLAEIYFKRKTDTITDDVWDMGWDLQYCEVTCSDGPTTSYHPAVIWRDHTPHDNPSYQPDSLKFQAVDWAYQTAPIEGPSDTTLKLRGVDTELQSSGVSAPQAGLNWANWPVRLFNILFSTNYKQFAAQFVDEKQTDPKAVFKFLKVTLRDRVQTVSSPQQLAQPIWNESNIKWADAALAGTEDGDFQIGDGPQDRIRASADVKGEGVAFQMFGHVMNAAERLRIPGAKAVVRLISGYRRKGRP